MSSIFLMKRSSLIRTKNKEGEDKVSIWFQDGFWCLFDKYVWGKSGDDSWYLVLLGTHRHAHCSRNYKCIKEFSTHKSVVCHFGALALIVYQQKIGMQSQICLHAIFLAQKISSITAEDSRKKVGLVACQKLDKIA